MQQHMESKTTKEVIPIYITRQYFRYFSSVIHIWFLNHYKITYAILALR